MRWLLIGLVVVGVGFTAVMLTAPGGGGLQPPGWTQAMGRAALRLAPRVTALGDGSRQFTIPQGGGEVAGSIPADPDRPQRILTLKLHDRSGPARAVYICTPTPQAPCTDATQTLCLGARHSDCDQDRITRSGSFAIGPGGGWLRILAADGAQVLIAD